MLHGQPCEFSRGHFNLHHHFICRSSTRPLQLVGTHHQASWAYSSKFATMNDTMQAQVWDIEHGKARRLTYFYALLPLMLLIVPALCWLSERLIRATRSTYPIPLMVISPYIALVVNPVLAQLIARFGVPVLGIAPVLPATCRVSINVEGPNGQPCYLSRARHWFALVLGPGGWRHLGEVEDRLAQDLKSISAALLVIILVWWGLCWCMTPSAYVPCKSCAGSPHGNYSYGDKFRSDKEIEKRELRGPCVCKPCECCAFKYERSEKDVRSEKGEMKEKPEFV